MKQTAPRIPLKTRRRTPNKLLTARRLNRGLSPNQLGQRVGCSGGTVLRAERGTIPHPRIQFAIAEELECTVLEIWPLDVQAKARV